MTHAKLYVCSYCYLTVRPLYRQVSWSQTTCWMQVAARTYAALLSHDLKLLKYGGIPLPKLKIPLKKNRSVTSRCANAPPYLFECCYIRLGYSTSHPCHPRKRNIFALEITWVAVNRLRRETQRHILLGWEGRSLCGGYETHLYGLMGRAEGNITTLKI